MGMLDYSDFELLSTLAEHVVALSSPFAIVTLFIFYSCLILVLFILPAAVLSSSDYNSTASVANVTWTSPLPGEEFQPGQTILAAWTTPRKIDAPSFSLCMEDSTGQNCGGSIYPTVTKAGSTSQEAYSMSIVVPNITIQGSFFIKMQSSDGDSFQSADFALTPAPNITATTSTTIPGFTGVNFPPNSAVIHAVPARSNAVAIGVPVTMIGLTVLAALAYLLSKRRREEREAGGSLTSRNLAPTIIAPTLLSNTHNSEASSGSMTSEKGKQRIDTGEASFFSISLNKTRSELTGVEKAVAGVLGGTGLVPDQSHAIRDVTVEPVRPIGDGRRSRMRLVEDDETSFTMAPPPRSWQGHRVRDRDREKIRNSGARAWITDKQMKRAEERERDRLWELERRERARRRLMMSRPTTYAGYGYEDSSRMRYRVRSTEEYYDPRDYQEAERTYQRPSDYEEFHDYRKQSALPDYLSRDRYPPSPTYHPVDRSISRSSYHAAEAGYNHGPSSRSLTAAYMPSSNSQPGTAPAEAYCQTRAPSRQAPRRSISDNQDHHSSLSVLSNYFQPSPYVSSPAVNFPASPYMPPKGPSGAEHPLFLQAGRPGTSSYGPSRPLGLDNMMDRSRPASCNTLPTYHSYPDEFGRRAGDVGDKAGYQYFASKRRDDRDCSLSQSRASHAETWSGGGERRSQSMMGDYIERSFPRPGY
ncbi:hypothetical protein FRB98_009364 [Tulasnella sp. 332]|nr:hypothetical protein FRB98_009364 [Tulasnella sp. 332]